MTAKEKASQLVSIFKAEQPMYFNEDDSDMETEKHDMHFGKRCAEKVCDQMNLEYNELARVVEKRIYDEAIKYWNKVRNEIKKIKI